MSAAIAKFPRSYLDEVFCGDLIAKTVRKLLEPVMQWEYFYAKSVDPVYRSIMVKANTKSEARAKLKKILKGPLPTYREGMFLVRISPDDSRVG